MVYIETTSMFYTMMNQLNSGVFVEMPEWREITYEKINDEGRVNREYFPLLEPILLQEVTQEQKENMTVLKIN